MIDITSVRVKLAGPETPDKRCLAYCSIIIDGCFIVHGLRVIQGQDRLIMVMPDRRKCPYCDPVDQEYPDRKYVEVSHPLTATCRAYLQERVLDAYRDELGRAENCPEEWDRKMDAVLDARKEQCENNPKM